MKIKRRRKQSRKLYHRLAFWIGVFVLGTAVGIMAQFTRAWVEPSSSAPAGNIAAPINTGATTQVKKGGDICVDTNGDGINEGCVGSGGGVPDGTITMWSGKTSSIPAGWVLCNGKNGTPDLRNRFVYGTGNGENPGATGGSTYSSISPSYHFNNIGANPGADAQSFSILPPYYKLAFIMKTSSAVSPLITGGAHDESECTAAGGTPTMDGAERFCKFVRSSCPSDWAQYQNWSTTTAESKKGKTENSCPGAKDCATSSHDWGNIARESCNYTDALWNSSSYEGYYCWGDISGCSPSDQSSGCSYNIYGDFVCPTVCDQGYGCNFDNSYCSANSTSLFAKVTEVGCY